MKSIYFALLGVLAKIAATHRINNMSASPALLNFAEQTNAEMLSQLMTNDDEEPADDGTSGGGPIFGGGPIGGGGSVSTNIQERISKYVETLTLPETTECLGEWHTDDDAEEEGYEFHVFIANCPGHPDSVVEVSYTDTISGWSGATQYCSNVETSGVQTDTTITKTYAVTNEAGVNVVAFQRLKTD